MLIVRLSQIGTVLTIVLGMIFSSSCRREVPNLVSEIPQSSGAEGGSYDATRKPSLEDIAFNAAATGNIEKLKNELSSGRVSIFSRSSATGKSLLETAVMSGSLEIVDYLISIDKNIIYGELVYLINNSGLIDVETKTALIEKITTGEQSQQTLDNTLRTLVENGIDDQLQPSDLDALRNHLFNKGADPTLTEFYNIPVQSNDTGSMRRLGVNLLYKALGCKRYQIEWIIDDIGNGETEIELDYFDIDCSGIRKPNFIKLLIEAGADFTQKVTFFDEPTTFRQLMTELREDFSAEEFDAILQLIDNNQAPLYKALGCKAFNNAGKVGCELNPNSQIGEENIKQISDLLAKGADPYHQTILKNKASIKTANFFQILNLLRNWGELSESDHNSLLTLTRIYK